MPQYGAAEIYRFARSAGFSPDQATTMTAIALAESGGRTEAHNTSGEDSRGLWQVNLDAHPQFQGMDMADPAVNARAAFEVSQRGQDISPWTVTHEVAGSRYLKFQDDAQAAAVANGDAGDLGQWDPPRGYGDHVPAGSADGAGPPEPLPRPGAGSDDDDDDDGPTAQDFIDLARQQLGDRYILGSTADPDDPDPEVWDCAELTGWVAARLGTPIQPPGTPYYTTTQYNFLADQGGAISVEEAMRTPGALLFTGPDQHVAISLGNGRTIEAMNSRVGVVEGEAAGRFTHAAIIPGLGDGPGRGLDDLEDDDEDEDDLPDLDGPDADADGLGDELEELIGLDVNSADTDLDGLSDAYELMETETDARLSDTDLDGMTDSVELAVGEDARKAGAHDGVDPTAPEIDTDSDGIDDRIEQILGLDAQKADSDGDGFSDLLEQRGGTDASDARSNPLDHNIVGVDLPAGLGAADELDEDDLRSLQELEDDDLDGLADLDVG